VICHSARPQSTAFRQKGRFDFSVDIGHRFTNGNLAPARQRLGKHEDVRRPGTLVFVVDAPGMSASGGDRHAGLLQQLHRLFVHAQDRPRRVVRLRVGLQHLFHVGYELTVGLGRDDPVFDLTVRHPVFFRVRRTVS
jgi:hypothetical protein